MPRLTASLHNAFESQVSSIEQTRAKMEALFLSSHINSNDIEHLYAGLYMELFTNFESLIESLFFGLFTGVLFTRTYQVVKLVKIQPASQVRNVVFAGKAYENWLPYKENTLKRAKRHFNNGEPFCQLSSVDIDNITAYHNIRNAIAHKSDNSLDKFNSIILGLPLLPHEKTPTGYLRSKPYGTGQTQFEIASLELRIVTRKLCL